MDILNEMNGIEYNKMNSFIHNNLNSTTILHLLCSQLIVSIKDIHLIIHLHPNEIKIKNKNGNLPIHLLCYKCKPCNIEVLKLLIKYYPESIDIRNNDNFKPYELAEKHANYNVLDYLYLIQSTTIMNNWIIKWNNIKIMNKNNTILHIRLYACASYSEIITILKYYPNYVYILNSKNQLPCDVALLNYNYSNKLFPYHNFYEYLNKKYMIIRAILQVMYSISISNNYNKNKNITSNIVNTININNTVISTNIIIRFKDIYLKHLHELNWNARKYGILVAYKLYQGTYFEVLKYIVLFL